MEENQNTETPVAETPTTKDFNIWDTPTTNNGEVQVDETKAPIVEPVVTEPTKLDAVEPTKAEPVVTEKIVEKIVERLPEFKDEYSKQIFDAIQDGKEDELYQYLSKKNKDYNTMSDVDVVKENLKLQNPKWTDKDVDIEIKAKFGTLPAKKDLSEIDPEVYPDEYQKAVDFNDRIDEKELLLSRDARDARLALEESKKNIEFPKITQEKAPEPVQLTQEQIDESIQKWIADVDVEMPKISEFKFKVGDEEVAYKITDEERASQADYMKKLITGESQVAKDLGWVDENGKENILKIAEDMLKLKHFDKILSSSATQMKTSATKDVVADIKNIDLTPTSTSPDLNQSVADMIWK